MLHIRPVLASRYFFIVRRVALLIPTIFLAFTLIFFLTQILPGDPAYAILGSDSTENDRIQFRHRLGLDRPLYVRYFDALSGAFKGDFGTSYRTYQSVTKMIVDVAPVTLTLAISSMLFALAIGIPSGIASALKQNTKTDVLVSVGAFLGLSIPGFWLGIMMILLFSVYLRILPASGFVPLWVNPIEGIRHLIMPTAVLGLMLAAFIARMTRSSLLEVLSLDYITAARAKGLRERVVIYKHALKNALIPVTTVLGFQFGGLLGGTVITETVFTITGMGRTAYWAVLDRDYPVIQAVLMLIVLIFVAVNLAIDVGYMFLDPRIRFE
jgi:peptide/nickel transport system permease protein